MAEAKLSPAWEKLRVVSGVVAAVLVPIAIALAGQFFSTALRERETQLKYVELAVGVLREKPSPETTEIRSWAIDLVNKFAPVPLSGGARNELKQRELKVTSAEPEKVTSAELESRIRSLEVEYLQKPSTARYLQMGREHGARLRLDR